MLEALEIEDQSLRAWPSQHTETYDDWLLRFAQGHTKRANSVNPRGRGRIALVDKVGYCEQRYAEQGLPSIFRLTSIADVGELDNHLAQSGYRSIEPSSVRCLGLSDDPGHDNPDAENWCDRLEAWCEVFHSFRGTAPVPAHRALLRRVPEPKALMVLRDDGTPVCCGLGVLTDACLGLFDFVTAPGSRRRGHANALVQSMLAWGKARGANTAYLQVVAENRSATALYDKFGFQERYHYWYRVK